MKVTGVQTIPVQPRWLFVKMETDAGLVGYGECLGDKASVVAEAVRSYEHHLIGEDPRRITHHWQSMYRGAFWRGGPTLCAAISGLEMCLWDILGKSLGAPVWQLLGRRGSGPHPRLHAAAWQHAGGAGGERERGRGARLTAMKFCPFEKVTYVDHYRSWRRRGGACRRCARRSGTTWISCWTFTAASARRWRCGWRRRCGRIHPMFIEEPVLPENVDALARFARAVKDAHRDGRAAVHQMELSRGAGKGRGDHFAARSRVSAAASSRRGRSARWRRPGTPRSRRTIPMARSIWPPACRWTPARRTF